MKAQYIGSTASGYVEYLGKEGHGKRFSHNFRFMPATIIAHDVDGWSFAYQYRGKRCDAIELIKNVISQSHLQKRADFIPEFEVIGDSIHVTRDY